jgi:hypothetical protein
MAIPAAAAKQKNEQNNDENRFHVRLQSDEITLVMRQSSIGAARQLAASKTMMKKNCDSLNGVSHLMDKGGHS